ncbi:MAG: perosamine synthetase [Chloroflexota bacterium]|nr:perosamine synthetase [Chloroflexota bacterium]
MSPELTSVRRIPLARPSIGDRERQLLEQVLSSGVLALGQFARDFEDAVAAVAGRAYGVACSSGTAGLHMAVRALGIADGDEVITTPFSFVASANCLLYERAVPRFVDIEEDSLGLDPDLVEAAAGPRTKGILPVHVFGRPCKIERMEALAAQRGWVLIEDACEALGSRQGDRATGSFGTASVFAFYPNKQITTGEGGVVVTDDAELASTIRSLRNQGRDEDGTWLSHVRLGYNYRLDEMSAAIGVAQLERLDELAAGRARVVRAYEAALGDREWLQLPRHAPDETVDWFVYVVRLDPTIDRGMLMEDLDARGVPARPYFSPIHLQPFYRDLGHKPGDFPVTERVAASTIALPFSAVLSDDDVAYVAAMLIEVVERRSRS